MPASVVNPLQPLYAAWLVNSLIFPGLISKIIRLTTSGNRFEEGTLKRTVRCTTSTIGYDLQDGDRLERDAR
jgi:hypothetical protein